MKKLRIREAVVVEGRYDKNALSQLVDGVIIETEGFGIFRDEEKMALLRLYASTRGLVVFTDSDGAGFVIRSRIRSAIPPSQLKHAYTPDIYGKEKRKRTASKEGKLGVEGMSPALLLDCLERAGAHLGQDTEEREQTPFLTGTYFYEIGLSGGPGSAEKRKMLCGRLGLPERISSRGLLAAVNELIASGKLSAEEFEALLGEINREKIGENSLLERAAEV